MRTLIVSAGMIIEQEKLLVTQRREGSSLGLLWEFPGGKVEEGEEPRQALRRELQEELGIEVEVGKMVDATFHPYAEHPVLLLIYQCRIEKGTARPLKSRDLRWVTLGELEALDMPAADEPIRKRLLSPKGDLLAFKRSLL